MNPDWRLRLHRTAMFHQKVSEARRVGWEFDRTMRQVASVAGAPSEDLQRLEARIMARAQQR